MTGCAVVSACLRWTPPSILRHLAPWWLLEVIDLRLSTCWSGMVMWKLGYEGWSWWPNCGCFDGSSPRWGGEDYDFCGKFETREEFMRAMGRRP